MNVFNLCNKTATTAVLSDEDAPAFQALIDAGARAYLETLGTVVIHFDSTHRRRQTLSKWVGERMIGRALARGERVSRISRDVPNDYRRENLKVFAREEPTAAPKQRVVYVFLRPADPVAAIAASS